MLNISERNIGKGREHTKRASASQFDTVKQALGITALHVSYEKAEYPIGPGGTSSSIPGKLR